MAAMVYHWPHVRFARRGFAPACLPRSAACSLASGGAASKCAVPLRRLPWTHTHPAGGRPGHRGDRWQQDPGPGGPGRQRPGHSHRQAGCAAPGAGLPRAGRAATLLVFEASQTRCARLTPSARTGPNGCRQSDARRTPKALPVLTPRFGPPCPPHTQTCTWLLRALSPTRCCRSSSTWWAPRLRGPGQQEGLPGKKGAASRRALTVVC